MAKIAILSGSKFGQIKGTPGNSLQNTTETHGVDNSEFYQLPGFYSKPVDGVRGVVVECAGFDVIIASNDYRMTQDIEAGETLIYSVDSSGLIKGKMLIDKDGLFSVANETQNLKTIFDAFVDAVKGIVTTGSPTTHTIDAASQTALDNIKTMFAGLVKE